MPVFGSLFTLTSCLLPFLRSNRRIWALTAACYVGVYVWFSGMQFDRYLQVILPWMAVVTAIVLALLWRTRNWLLRSATAALVALQVIWGLDLFAIPSHAMTGQSPMTKSLSLIATGYQKQYEQRLNVFQPYSTIGAAMQPGDKILLHEQHVRLGLKVPVVSDAMPIQCGIDYGRLADPAAVFQAVREMGVTHAVWVDGANFGWVSYAGELVFYHFLARHTDKATSYGGYKLAKLKEAPALPTKPDRVAFFGCQAGYRWGLYELSALNFPDTQIPDPALYPAAERLEDASFSAAEILSSADYLIHNASCRPNMPPEWKQDFTRLTKRGTDQLYVRTSLTH
jgi:hypothetical protein